MKQIINNYSIKNFLFIGLIFCVFYSCGSNKSSVVWVNSLKTACTTGTGETQCMSIYRGDNLENPTWELFYGNIEGFNFEAGYFQQLKIQEKQLDPKNVPADASSIKYTLTETLQKKMDKRFILNDIWATNTINGNPINRMTTVPRLEINLSKMRIYGTNGCNNYNGIIKCLTANTIEFGNISSTRKMCRIMTIPNLYDTALRNSVSYTLVKTKLIFFDKHGNQTIHFMKVD